MLDKLSYYWRIYRKIIFQDIKTKMSYRSDFIISMIGIIVTNVAGFISFWIIFKNFPKIGNWNYYQMLFFYGFSLITLTPMQCLFDNNWNLRLNVFTGDFIKYCFRPINLFFYYMSEVFDVKGLTEPSPAFSVGVPLFDKITISLNGNYYKGKRFVIEQKRRSDDDCYVKRVELNGKEMKCLQLPFKSICDGGRLVVNSSSTPNTLLTK